MFHFLDPILIIKTLGVFGVIAVVFAETGLFFGFFLPGDSLLFTAGLLASQEFLNIWILLFGCFLAAIIGDSVGYAFGFHAGPKIFSKEDSRFFKKKYLEQTKIFYAKHGKMAIVMARFVPIVRTFAPILAGVGSMRYREFLIYNISGGILWVFSMVLLGFGLGKTVPNIDAYIIPIVILIIVVSLIPSALHLIKARREGQVGDRS